MKEIRAIIKLYGQLKREEVACALAVVVDVAQSSYRRIGARMLVAADGRYVGGISGGCLEGDALRRAKKTILSGRPSVQVYDTTDGEDQVIGIGLGCEGRIEVAFFPLDLLNDNNEVELLKTLINIRSSRLLLRRLSKSGRAIAEAAVLAEDQDAWRRQLGVANKNRSKVLKGVAGSLPEDRWLVEVLQPTIHLVLTGTNYDIPPTLRAARALGWRTTVIGARRKITKEISDLAGQVLDYGDANQVRFDEATAVALMSHDYDWDRKMVQLFHPQSPAYLGMLGPRKRMLKMDRSLPDIDLQNYPNLYAPVGLDIGAETPEEIAASLVAEIIMHFRERTGGALRARVGSIHF